MVTDFAVWGSRLFPTIRLSIHTRTRSSQIVLGPAMQAVGLAVALSSLGALGFVAVRWVAVEQRAVAERAAEMRMERANVDLQAAIATLQDKVGAAARERAQAMGRLDTLKSRSAMLRGLLRAAENKLETLTEQVSSSTASSIAQLTRQLRLAEAQRATLVARLSKVEEDEREQQSRYGQSASERDQLKALVNRLQQQLSLRSVGPSTHQQARATPASPAPATAPGAVGGITRTAAYEPAARRALAGARSVLGEVERVLASTGLDVERLFAASGVNADEGGPFVPPPQGGKPPGQLSRPQLLALRRLTKSLPLSMPMASYRLTSPFGMRRDPFNGRPAFHPGVDLAAPYGTPVYATAPGTVVYAGWESGYGKLVEIDDGNGISTRYGHLHRFTVVVGERVAAGTQIGDEGSTGRSTGPHVIYEVRVNGKPQDPEKFYSLGQVISVASR
jgi:murein DD-endopeptidase MepM/ murein hydrolase activator NlpD